MFDKDFQGRPAYYKSADDKNNYELRFPGDAGELFTEDDAVYKSPTCETSSIEIKKE